MWVLCAMRVLCVGVCVWLLVVLLLLQTHPACVCVCVCVLGSDKEPSKGLSDMASFSPTLLALIYPPEIVLLSAPSSAPNTQNPHVTHTHAG